MDKVFSAEDLTIKVITELSELNANMKNTLTRIENHETRIQSLEQNKTGFKADIVSLLAKALTIALVSIASLSGAGALLKGIFGL